MGINISKIPGLIRFFKSPDVYKKELDGVNREIHEKEQQKDALEYQYDLITQIIVSYSRLIYVMLFLIFFFSTLPSTLLECVLFCGPLLVIYILVRGLKLCLKWYYEHEIKRTIQKLSVLQSRKKKILEEVKEKVKFNEAKDIIEKYSVVKEKNGLRDQDRNLGNYYKRRQSSFDTVIKYVLNEDKDTALICKYCSCNNGLALKEDFEHMSFRCCRCFMMNQAKSTKSMPLAIES